MVETGTVDWESRLTWGSLRYYTRSHSVMKFKCESISALQGAFGCTASHLQDRGFWGDWAGFCGQRSDCSVHQEEAGGEKWRGRVEAVAVVDLEVEDREIGLLYRMGAWSGIGKVLLAPRSYHRCACQAAVSWRRHWVCCSRWTAQSWAQGKSSASSGNMELSRWGHVCVVNP